ncbi:6-phosphogluconolactonase [uncultured Marinobacter sp.]|mgnify:CR=1 FL=1|uniref:6-phosphogluconolactonase n=1 Tax=uncultured Marinobacter sp. TaxID=187379 RepID=UPI0030DAD58E
MKMPELTLPDTITPVFADTPRALCSRLASDMADVLAKRLQQRSRVLLVVSGGSTPGPLFDALAQTDLPWERVDVVLADERWAPDGGDDRNDTLVRGRLITGKAAQARLISLIPVGQDSITSACAAAEQQLRSLGWPADVVVLGMGNDGHTASLFPDASETPAAMMADASRKVTITRPRSQPRARLSLTFSALRGAAMTVLHLRGNDKLETLRCALADPDDTLAMPIRGFLKHPIRLYWSP